MVTTQAGRRDSFHARNYFKCFKFLQNENESRMVLLKIDGFQNLNESKRVDDFVKNI